MQVTYTPLPKALWQRKLKHILNSYKLFFGCEVCRYKESAAALHFHHRDPEQKNFKPTTSSHMSWETRLKEMDKCSILCANCHERLHAGEVQLCS